MKKTMCFLSILFIFASCNNANENKGDKNSEISSTDVIIEETGENAYTNCQLAYRNNNDELYFYNTDEKRAVKFVEEEDIILNFVFDDSGEIFYYTVERDSALWLKSADMSKSKITPKWVIDWQLTKEEDFSYLGMSPLYYHQGRVIILYGFHLDSQYFNDMNMYIVSDEIISHRGHNYELIGSSYGELTWEEQKRYFETIDENVYYIQNNTKVCLSNKIDFRAIEEKNKDEFEISVYRSFGNYSFSPDSTKILFSAEMLEREWVQGPYCIANIDGRNQMVLEESDRIIESKPIWLKNNSVVFIDYENNIYVANNDDNSIEKIAENVSDFKSRYKN